MLDVGQRLTCCHQVSCRFPSLFPTLFLSPSSIFVCTSAASTTLKPCSRNSLGQPLHPSLSPFLANSCYFFSKTARSFSLSQWCDLLSTHLDFGNLLLNTHVSNFQNSKGKDNLSCASSSSVTPLLFPPAEQVSGSLSSQAMTPVSPYYLLHSISKCHLQYLDQLILPQGLPQGLFFPFLSWPATTTHTHWYSCLWLSFTTASTAN